MAIEPKKLNEVNTEYGKHPLDMAKQGSIGIVFGTTYYEGIESTYYKRKYADVIEACLYFVKKIKSIEDLEKMAEEDMVVFYYLGMSYEKIGETEKAISCLHIAASQYPFKDKMNRDFPKFVDKALEELQLLAQRCGEAVVNNNDPARFLRKKKRGGCFIATAVYGSEESCEVALLKRYRDGVLAKTRTGRMFTEAYYRISPTLVTYMNGNVVVLNMIRKCLLQPIVDRIRSRYPEFDRQNDSGRHL